MTVVITKHSAHVAAYNMHNDALNAEAWKADNVVALYEKETRDDRLMVYGAEYFQQVDTIDDEGNVWQSVCEPTADINTDDMAWAERHGQYLMGDHDAHKPNRAPVQQAVTLLEDRPVAPRHSVQPTHANLFHDTLSTPARWGCANVTGATYGAKRWTATQRKALVKRMAECKADARVFGIADIVGSKATGVTVSRAAQYADKQDSARRSAKRAAKRAARFASKM